MWAGTSMAIGNACYPANYKVDEPFHYSPGRCPVGWTVATQGISEKDTIQACFPSVSKLPFKVYRDDPWISGRCNYPDHGVVSVRVVTVDGDGLGQRPTVTTEYAVHSQDYLNVYGIVVKFQETDLSLLQIVRSSAHEAWRHLMGSMAISIKS